jgi:enamine deaminase RidA (YjgF/YER057c/UK114 family)
MKKLNPTTIAPPFARYSHAVEVPAEARLLYLAGQVGVTPEGELPSGAEAQIELAWQNILAVPTKNKSHSGDFCFLSLSQ